MVLIILLLMVISASALANPDCDNLPFQIDVKYKTVKEIGEKYRRADVVIYVPVFNSSPKYRRGEKPPVNLNFRFNRGIAEVRVRAKEHLKGELILVQPIKKGFVYEEAEVRRVISRVPDVEEVFMVYPVDVKRNYVSFPLPEISAGEELVVRYRFKGSLGKPYLKYARSEVIDKLRRRVFLRIKYSFLFKYAKTTLNDENLRNIEELLSRLRELGLNVRVEIIGYADGKTNSPKRNERIAKRRALEVATRILPAGYKWCITRSIPIVKLNR